MSNLSELIGGGGGGNGKTAEFVASGTLPSGKNVMLNPNGTVSLSGLVTATEAIPDGGQQTGPAWSYGGYYTFLPSTPNKIIWVWTNSSGYFVCNIGTVSGTTVTFDSDKYPFGSVANTFSPLQIKADPTQANRILVLGSNSSGYGCVVSGILVDGAMVWSTVRIALSKGNFSGKFGFDPATTSTSKFVITCIYRDSGNAFAGACLAGYMALGNTAPVPTIGTPAIWRTPYQSYAVTSASIAVRPDVAGSFVILYSEVGYTPPSGYYCRGCSVTSGTGTTITLGTAVKWTTESGAETHMEFDPNGTAGKFITVYAYRPNTNNALAARVGTLSGSSVSFGSTQSLANPPYDKNAGVSSQCISFQANTGGVFSIVYHSWNSNSEPYRARCRLGTYSGTTITFQTEILLPNIYAGNGLLQAGDPNNSGFFVVNPSASNYGVWACQMAVPVPNTTANNYLGITQADIATGATGEVVMKGGITPITGGTYTITVVNSGSGNKYAINGVEVDVLNLYEGATYKFDQSSGTNAGHPFRFSTTADGTHAGGSEYTTGVTTSGTPGSAGAYTQIILASGAPTLYYYCSVHSGMGGTAFTLAIVPNSDYYVQSNGTLTTASAYPAVKAGRAMSATSINLEYS